MNGLYQPELDSDRPIAAKYGAYAGFATPHDPILEEYHGDSPSDEFDRLLAHSVTENSRVIDLGCGAGFTTCRVAKAVRHVVAIDLEPELIKAAKSRAASRLIENVTFVEGDTSDPITLTYLREGIFDVVYSRRGPFLNNGLMRKLTKDAVFVVELAQDFLGLKEIFGRYPSFPKSMGESDWAISSQSAIGMIPVSAKSYWYELYFADSNHLANYLSLGSPLTNWWMEPCPYREDRDRPALDLYCKYNWTPKGVRLVGSRRVYLFRRQSIDYYPALG